MPKNLDMFRSSNPNILLEMLYVLLTWLIHCGSIVLSICPCEIVFMDLNLLFVPERVPDHEGKCSISIAINLRWKLYR